MIPIFDKILNLDYKLFLILNGLNVPKFIDSFFIAITNVHFLLFVALSIITFLFFKLKKQAIFIVIILFLGIGIGDFTGAKLKRAAMVKRPSDKSLNIDAKFLIGRKSSPSFPSNHSINWGFISVYLLLVLKNREDMKLFRISLFIFGILVSYSRVAVGVHFPIDILFGFLYGTLLAIIFSKTYQKFNKKKGFL